MSRNGLLAMGLPESGDFLLPVRLILYVKGPIAKSRFSPQSFRGSRQHRPGSLGGRRARPLGPLFIRPSPL